MGVQGYLSLYTILLGWQSYDALWSILTQLGFVILPFAFISIKSFMEPFLSMGAKDAGVMGARRFIINIMVALFVLLFAGAPWVHLDPTVLHYQPHCEHTGKIATPGNTGTTYDSLLPVPNDIKVPMVWYIVMAISNGITDEAEDAISCPTVNLRALQNELNLTSIKGVATKQEVKRFYQSCYLPSYNKFVSDNSSGKNITAIKSALGEYGDDDVSWVGSLTLQKVSGYYDSFSAQAPVVGFPFTSKGISNQVNSQTQQPKWGAPTCYTWWNEPEIGLKDRLFSQFSKNFKAQLAEFDADSNHNLAKNMAIRAMLSKSTGGGFVSAGFYTEQANQSGTDNFLAKWASKGMTDYAAVEEYPKIQILKNALPVIQAVLLAAFCMMLSIALPLASYSIRFVVTAAIFMFSIIFCSFLWHWVSWFDQFLLEALYGAGPMTGHSDPAKLIWNLAESAINPEKNLVDITISVFYIALPLIWLSVVGWCGVSAGSAMNFGSVEGLSQRVGGTKIKLPKKRGGI